MNPLNRYKRFHFVGIGGIGMSAVAQMMLRLGYKVSGSDLKSNSLTRLLESLGARIYEGHSSHHLGNSECVIYSSSVGFDNPELKEAKKKGIWIWHRSEILAALTKDKWTAAVTGTHGKTTTTSMLGMVFKEAGRSPTVLVGAKVGQMGGNLLMGSGPEMIIEADESDASFLKYTPDDIIITNIDRDHLDYFKSMEGAFSTYAAFIKRLKQGGKWWGCGECPYVKRLLQCQSDSAVSYGFGPGWDYSARRLKSLGPNGVSFVFNGPQGDMGEIHLKQVGMHNALNATAVCALASRRGLSFSQIQKALAEYTGAARRFEVIHETPDLLVIDDYAHHPTEVKATLETARQFSSRRLVAIFQPHRYSRTKDLREAFETCFEEADEVIVTDIYAAGENPIKGVNARELTGSVARHRSKPTSYAPRKELLEAMSHMLRKGDMILTMGAGDIGEVAKMFCKKAAA